MDAVCSRAIIIDRGSIVANGTPQQLRQKSDMAGSVTLRVGGQSSGTVSHKLSQIPSVKKVLVLKEESSTVTVRVIPNTAAGGSIANTMVFGYVAARHAAGR